MPIAILRTDESENATPLLVGPLILAAQITSELIIWQLCVHGDSPPSCQYG